MDQGGVSMKKGLKSGKLSGKKVIKKEKEVKLLDGKNKADYRKG